MQSQEIQLLLKRLSKLPGLGPRSARRVALFLLKEKEKNLYPLLGALEEAYQHVTTCQVCGNLDVTTPCMLCVHPNRDEKTLCIVADVDDLWAIERTQTYKGAYHVLGGVLSAFQGTEPKDLHIEGLISRIQEKGNRLEEIILALGATLDGQTTAHYIYDTILPHFKGRFTRLAHGVPVGGELDYLDDGTLGAALSARVAMD